MAVNEDYSQTSFYEFMFHSPTGNIKKVGDFDDCRMERKRSILRKCPYPYLHTTDTPIFPCLHLGLKVVQEVKSLPSQHPLRSLVDHELLNTAASELSSPSPVPSTTENATRNASACWLLKYRYTFPHRPVARALGKAGELLVDNARAVW